MSNTFSEIHLINPDQTDPFGQITMATIFRYMQSAATNYNQDIPELQKIDRNDDYHWLIYYSNVEMKNFITYNNKVKITTWLDDYKKALARRKYRIEDIKTHDVIATGFTDWIYFNRSKMRPASVNPIVDQILFNQSPAKHQIKRIKIIPFDLSEKNIEIEQPVTLNHIDINHHVNNTVYLDYFLNSFSLAHDEMGINLNEFLSKNLSWIPKHYQIQYNLSAIIGDKLKIFTKVKNIDDDQALWEFQIYKKDENKAVTIAKVTYKLRNNYSKKYEKIPLEYKNKIMDKFDRIEKENY